MHTPRTGHGDDSPWQRRGKPSRGRPSRGRPAPPHGCAPGGARRWRMASDSESMSHSLAKVAIHLVFSTQHRKQILSDGIRPAFHGYVATVLRNLQCPVLAINSLEEHVHILFELGRTVAVSRAVEDIKRTSSRWMKTQGTDFKKFAWQSGYGAFAVSESNTAKVRRYIERQREHHQRWTFEDEYRAFLQRHGVAYEEAHLWT